MIPGQPGGEEQMMPQPGMEDPAMAGMAPAAPAAPQMPSEATYRASMSPEEYKELDGYITPRFVYLVSKALGPEIVPFLQPFIANDMGGASAPADAMGGYQQQAGPQDRPSMNGTPNMEEIAAGGAAPTAPGMAGMFAGGQQQQKYY